MYTAPHPPSIFLQSRAGALGGWRLAHLQAPLDRNDPLATSGHKSDRQKNQPNTLDAYPVYLAGYCDRMLSILNYINITFLKLCTIGESILT